MTHRLDLMQRARRGVPAHRKPAWIGHAFEPTASRAALMAEMAVAARLREAGFALARDVPSPSGRTADFEAVRNGVRFHVHVKFLADEPTTAMAGRGAIARAPRSQRDRIPRVLRELETIERPIEVALRWRAGAGCSAFRRMVREVTPFLRSGRTSEERIARDSQGREIGRVRILGPRRDAPASPRSGSAEAGGEAAREPGLRRRGGNDRRLKLVGEWTVRHRDAQAARSIRLLRKALAQFMPGSFNLIVLVGRDPGQIRAIDQALFGTVVEAWDRFPPLGERVAHGRADDGFWSRGRASASRAVAWMLLPRAPRPSRASQRGGPALRSPRGQARTALWLREGAMLADRSVAILGELFGSPTVRS